MRQKLGMGRPRPTAAPHHEQEGQGEQPQGRLPEEQEVSRGGNYQAKFYRVNRLLDGDALRVRIS
ncbi:hypothetical protein GCM10027589_17270 [Actinocorallia lasiicapitis]